MFHVINNIYTKRNYGWIKDEEIPQPVIVLKWLGQNPATLPYVNILNKYAYYLSPKEFLLLAISIMPKYEKAPFNKYLKPVETEEKYFELWNKIQKSLEISDNDMVYVKKYVDIEKNKVEWFKKLGIDKSIWKKYDVDYDNNKGQVIKGKSGLDLFGF